MALAATPAINLEHESHSQRRALELPEQDMHLFARSPIPVIPTAQGIADGGTLSGIQQNPTNAVPENSGQSIWNPKLKARLDGLVNIGDKAKESIAQAERNMGSSGQPLLNSQQKASLEKIALDGRELKQFMNRAEQSEVYSKYPPDSIKFSHLDKVSRDWLKELEGRTKKLEKTVNRAIQKVPKSNQHPGGSGQVPQKKGLWNRMKEGVTGVFKGKGDPSQQPGGSDQVPQRKGAWNRMKEGVTGVFKGKGDPSQQPVPSMTKGEKKAAKDQRMEQKKAAKAAKDERIDQKYDPKIQRLKEKQAVRAEMMTQKKAQLTAAMAQKKTQLTAAMAQKKVQLSTTFGKMMGK
ncbi:hypothetical protein BDEG_24459 [Batrachochytrium dendrobatidis JEL423]|uniref:Uncharacterized protein n=1 Tax=Batrachochytrium dendrobatidis (strain JEL423) TaxID=403673 RepID=A0A177WKX7_BATDL|nr:hypothetical protein BDEG_24459 [Batrachochytrium dendrobatidis JEL423]